MKNINDLLKKIPEELRLIPQWIVWVYDPDGRDFDEGPLDRVFKRVLNPSTFRLFDTLNYSGNSQTWASFDEALKIASSSSYAGIGFVCSQEGPAVFIDFSDIDRGMTELIRQSAIYNKFNHSRSLGLIELLHIASNSPQTEFTTEYLTPKGEITLLSANGGVGKTFLTLQWLLSIALGAKFFGLNVKRAPVLFVTAEDRVEECARRLKRIYSEIHGESNDLVPPGFHIWEILGKPLWVEEPGTPGRPTEAMIELEGKILAIKAEQVAIDNAALVFLGNHNDNVSVTAFLKYLVNMAVRTNCNILLLAHVNADSLVRGGAKSYYGSTAWHNGPRSRLYMELRSSQSGSEPQIVVTHEKSNYGKLADPFILQRSQETGVLRLVSLQEIASEADEKVSILAEQVFADILALSVKGEFLNIANQGSNTAYLKLHREFPGKYKEDDRKHKKEVKTAIQKLSDKRRIVKKSQRTSNGSWKEVWAPNLPKEGVVQHLAGSINPHSPIHSNLDDSNPISPSTHLIA